MFFQQTDVLAIALDSSVGKITDERNEADEEVDSEVDQHHEKNTVGQAAFNLAHMQNQVECEQGIGCVTYSWDEANDGGPAEAHAEEGEKRIVEAVGCLAGFGQDVGFLGWDVGCNFLLHFLGLALLGGMRNLIVVWVLEESVVVTGV